MNRLWNISFASLFVSFFVTLFVTSLLVTGSLAAQMENSPHLQKGVSVEMAVTTGASTLPDADDPNAWIVSITENGNLYFGVERMTPESLLEAMKVRPRNREQELYIKADERAPVADVGRVLDVARASLFKRVFLLTAQPGGAQPGEIGPPHGLPLWVAEESPASVVISVSPGAGLPRLRIMNEQVPLAALQHKLEQLLRNQNDRVVLIKAEQVPFGDIVRVIDVCQMAGARPLLATPAL